MQSLQLRNFRKSVNARTPLTDFSMLVGKNNSGKSNIAKALLMISDYLESDNLLDFPLDGPNSIYHNINSWMELQTWHLQDNRSYSRGQTPDNSNLPEIEFGLLGDAKLTITLGKNESNYPFTVMVNKIEIHDESGNILFRASAQDLFFTEVLYSIERIQQFLKTHKIQSNTNNNNQKQNIEEILNYELQIKNSQLEITENTAEKARLRNDIKNLESKIERISASQDYLKEPKISSFLIRTGYLDYSRKSVLELLTSFIPNKWAWYCASQNEAESNEVETAQKHEVFVETENTLDDEEPEFDSVKNTKSPDHKAYRELLTVFSKFIYKQLGLVHFSPVNRYTPYREYIDSNIFSQRNHVDLIADVAKLLQDGTQLYLSGGETSFIDKWLTEFGIATKHNDENGMLLQIRKESSLGFSIFVHDNTLIAQKSIYGYVNLADKGYGSGQILAILLKICVSSRSVSRKKRNDNQFTTIILEEPESNLHPDYQAKLIDMLWDAHQKFSIRFIIECHSEYMIRRLQVLVKNKDLLPSQVGITYFSETENEQITIQENGFLNRTLPSGFMDIAAHMAIEIL